MTLILVSTLFISTYTYFLIKHGKNPVKGGKLAPCKKIWLFYTLYTWFIFLPVVLFEGYVSESYRLSFTLLTASMWFRAPIELIMLYKTKNWTPPIGITHNLITLALFLYPFIGIKSIQFDIEFFFAASLALSLILETYYAVAFYKIVREKTKGDEGIWFANKEDPQFKKILNVTTVFNYPVLIGVFAAFVKYLS